MNVLFFTSFVSHESGASHALRETVRRVAVRGVKPVVVVPDCPDSHEMFPPTEFDTVFLQIERPRKARNPLLHARFCWFSFLTLLALRRLIRQRNIQIVHFNEITDFLGGVAARLCGTACVCHVRADGLPNMYRRLLIPVLKRVADAVVVPSKSTSEWIRGEDHDLAARTHLIHDHAFDIREYERPGSGVPFRDEFGFSREDVLVLLVSKLIATKGHACFIRAAEKVLGASPGIRFAIVGGNVPGHDEDGLKIQALARQLTPPPGLRLVGHRTDLSAVYAACDIAVHCPVFPDTYPTVVLLAMAAGKAIVGSSIGGIPEQIEDGKTGILVPPDDPGALADAILQLARDPAKRSSLGMAAMRRIRGEFAPETQGRLLTELYAEVTGGGTLKRSGGRASGSLESLSRQEPHVEP
jgi:glycosyltransferase involved in cell wall biosynthesis